VDPERWRLIEEVFQGALGREAGERLAFLEGACAADAGLRREVESLLVAHEKAGGILDRSRAAHSDEALDALKRSGDPTNLVGTMVNGRYRVDALLGEGGMGVVYRATDMRGGTLALKVVRGNLFTDPYVARRFRREAEAVARVRHPNVVAVFELGLAPGVGVYIAMECLEGHTLRDEMFERRRLHADDVLGYGSQICAGVGAAHVADVVHRDLKPENVFLVAASPRARVKVLDFGVAKLADAAGEASRSLTSTGAFLGTPAYAAPEQWGGGVVGARSDVYAIGCLLFEMLVGRPPFVSRHPAELMRQHLAREPERPSCLVPDVPDALEAAILKALSKDPAERFPSAAALGRALSE
jgi:eukaryotic-like serine/threonine-protein kinase